MILESYHSIILSSIFMIARWTVKLKSSTRDVDLIARTECCRMTISWARFTFFCRATLYRWCSCLIEMNDGTSFVHTALLSVWARPDSCVHPGWEQDPEAGQITPRRPIYGKRVFPAPLLCGLFVVWRRAHPVLILSCLISQSKTPFPLPAGSDWSRLTLPASRAIC